MATATGILEKMSAKLREMQSDGHNATVNPDWVSSTVTVVKDGNDPKDLNSAIRREHYHILTMDKVIASMP